MTKRTTGKMRGRRNCSRVVIASLTITEHVLKPNSSFFSYLQNIILPNCFLVAGLAISVFQYMQL